MDRERITLSDLELAGMTERDIAFQCWALQADRSPTKTAAIMLEDYGLEVDPAKISVWKGRYDWDRRAKELLGDVAPTFIERTAALLVGGMPKAMQYLVDVAEGKPETRDAKGLVDRGRVAAALGLVDRGGFLPNTRKEAQRGGTPVRALSSGDAWVEMSRDELERLVRERVQDVEP